MRLLSFIGGIVTVVMLGGVMAHAQGNSATDGLGKYIVAVKEGTLPGNVAKRHGLAARFEYTAAANGFAVDLPAHVVARLRQDPDVETLVIDRDVFAIGKPSGGTTTNAPQVVPAGVQRIGATSSGYTGDGIGVAIVDTGIDLKNTDLKLGAKSCYAIGRSATDEHGHGTHVAGIVAALNNSIGVVGVAPKATVYAVRVLDKNGTGSDSTVIAGLDWIAKNWTNVSPKILVVNMSLGRQGSLDDNPVYRKSVSNLWARGISVIVAAGNSATNEVSQMVPACYPEVIAVASTTAKMGSSAYPGFSGVLADTASYFTTDGTLTSGSLGVTISAPGEDQEDVSSTGSITSIGILSLKLGGGTTRMSGTSMAAPHAAGVAALLLQKSAGALAVEDIRDRIERGASNISIAPYDNPTGTYTFDGYREGILDANGALGLVQ